MEGIKNFGKKSIEEIDNVLAEKGYRLMSKAEFLKEAKHET